MGETIRLKTFDGRDLVLGDCEDKLRDFCLHDAYEAYDRTATIDDVATMRQFNAVNEAMKARTPLDAWRPFLDPHPIPFLSQVPKDVDLIDSIDLHYIPAREAVGRVYGTLASTPYITDMASSKVCFLKRPAMIAISDSYIRKLLLGPDESIDAKDPARGRKYAERGVRVMDAVREVGRQNAAALQNLWVYAQTLNVDGQPVVLSKARILDILIWVEEAIKAGHPYWGRRAKANPSGLRPSAGSPETDPRSREDDSPVPDCPKCGGAMVQRTGPKGSFYGCKSYPQCKGTRSLFACPKCRGDMTQRQGPKGPFYGCLRFPGCKGTRNIDGSQPPQRLEAEAVESNAPSPGWMSWIVRLFGR